MPTRDETSAGGIVLRRSAGDSVEVALIATHGGERWALPKGLVNRGEAVEETALREVREETGLEAEIVSALEPIEYWFWWGPPGRKVRHHKRVHYYLMRWLGGDTSLHDAEVDDVQWFALEEAVQRLSYESERRLLEATQVKVEEGWL
jgi:ADP-ribose pyrophosphatase YjhB (NUDIX family)